MSKLYKKIDQQDIAYLSSLFDEKYFFTGDDIPEDYSKDELGALVSKPDVLVFVHNAEEISKVMTYANENKIPVVVRGSGTGLVGGCVPLEGGIVICTAKMNRILELDENNLTLTVEPGVLLFEITQFVESRGYFYAPDPGEKTATIGGNISTNAGGMRAVKYGTTRDWVVGLEVVLPNGDIEQFGRKVVKDSTGFSLKNLIIGSEGTLAIVTKAILKVMPKPKETLSLLVPFETQEKGLEAVGVGYRFNVAGKKLTVNAGYSNPVEVEVPAELNVDWGFMFPEPIGDTYFFTAEGVKQGPSGRLYAAPGRGDLIEPALPVITCAGASTKSPPDCEGLTAAILGDTIASSFSTCTV